MPVLVSLKKPPVTLAVKGSIDQKFLKDISKQFPALHLQAIDGQNLIIPTPDDTNIAYIKEITQEQFDEMQEQKKEQFGGSRVVKPEASLMFPSQRGRGGKKPS